MTWLLKAVFGGSNGMEARSIRRDLKLATSRLTLVGALLLAGTGAGAQQRSGASHDDRIVAERVLRLGGAVILEGQRRPILDLDDLPDTAISVSTRWISSACRWAPGA